MYIFRVVSQRFSLQPQWCQNAISSVLPYTTKPQPKPVVLLDEEIEEKHVRGWGNGGQKLNKTSSCVQLLHKPTGTMVICQDTRYLQQNRKIARKRLTEKLDLLFNGEHSKAGKKIQKLQARKHKQRQRSKKKYGGVSEDAEKSEDGEATKKPDTENSKPE